MSSSSNLRRGVKPASAKIIKAVKRPPVEAQFETAWGILANAIGEIQKKNASVLSFEELYRNAYNMVLFKMGDKLYSSVKSLVASHLKDITVQTIVPAFPTIVSLHSSADMEHHDASEHVIMAGLSSAVSFSNSKDYLKVLKRVWEEHTTCMIMVRDILLYMDRVYIKTTNKPLVFDMGLDLFRDIVWHSPSHPVQEKAVQTIMNQILLDREGEVVDRFALKSITDMLLSLNNIDAPDIRSGLSSISVYEQDFELYFLATTRRFYAMEAQALLETCNAPMYLLRVETRLREEDTRVQTYLSAATGSKVRMVLEEVLIQERVEDILMMHNSGLSTMITDSQFQDIRRMYQLFGRVSNGHSEMRKVIAREIQKAGKEMNILYCGVNNANSSNAAMQENAIKWVEACLSLKSRYDKILDESCFKDKAFRNTVNDAMGTFVNANMKCSEFLSQFIDDCLKKGQKGKYESELESTLDNTVSIFRLLVNKDVFERYYKQHLAKRLLFGRSLSEDMEKSFIGRLKIECGSQFTSKLEGMFTDMKLSEEMTADFQSKSISSSEEGQRLELHVKILTITLWPNFTTTSVNYPERFSQLLTRFEQFYLSKKTGRKLTWLASMSNADIRAYYPKGRKEISISFLGMIVLVTCFQGDGEDVSYATIALETGIPDAELKRVLQSLSLGKYKLIVKKKKGREIDDNDVFALNMAFTCPMTKIKVLSIKDTSSNGGLEAIEGGEEREEIQARVSEERKHLVEAAIVRVMKSRKRVDYSNLVTEVTLQLKARFMPNPNMIKTRIEELIEREYLERDADDRRVYKYIA